MEEIIRRCDGLSLSAKEGTRVTLTRTASVSEHVLAAKFLMKEKFEYGGRSARFSFPLVNKRKFSID